MARGRIPSGVHEEFPGLRRALLGEVPPSKQIDQFSSELHLAERTPPKLLPAASDDAVSEKSINFYLALRKHKVPAELVLLERALHGFWELTRDECMDPMRTWLRRNGWLLH